MRALLLSIGIILGLSNPSSSAQSQELQIFRIGTGGVSGTYYPIGGMIAHAISNPPGDRPCEQGGSCGPPGLVVIAQAANGSVANANDIQQKNLESGFVQSDVAYWAYTGTGTFKGEPPRAELRGIANLYPESIHIVTRRDSGINSVRDLIGKRVSLDEPGSGTLIDAGIVLNEYEVSISDIEAEYMKADLAIKRIRNNMLDAFFMVAGYPAPAIVDLAADTEIKLIPIDGREAERLAARYRFFSSDDVPAGVYPGVVGVSTLSVGAQWLVAASVDDQVVYGITRALWNDNSRMLLDRGHPRGKHITLETALQGIAIPLHPGARRFYDEIGMSVQ